VNTQDASARAINDLVTRGLDRSSPATERLAALRSALKVDPTRAKHALLAVGGDESESDEMLEATGEILGQLCWAGLVSEFDSRDLTERASTVLFKWTP
jgi:hypothetical protein